MYGGLSAGETLPPQNPSQRSGDMIRLPILINLQFVLNKRVAVNKGELPPCLFTLLRAYVIAG